MGCPCPPSTVPSADPTFAVAPSIRGGKQDKVWLRCCFLNCFERSSELLVVFIRHNEQSSPGVARRVADGFVGGIVEGLLAGAATLHCSASPPIDLCHGEGALANSPSRAAWAGSHSEPALPTQTQHTDTAAPLQARPSLSSAGWQLTEGGCAARSPRGFVASAAVGNGLQEPLLHRGGLGGHWGAEHTGSPIFCSPASTARGPQAALVLTNANVTEWKSAVKKTSVLFRKEQHCVLLTKLIARKAMLQLSVSEGASVPRPFRSAVAELLSQAVTLLPNPQQNMDDDSVASALAFPGPAKGHIFLCESCMAQLTPRGPAWSLGHGGCSEQCVSHPPWPWGWPSEQDFRHRAVHLCASQQRLRWTQRAPEVHLG